MPLVCCFEKTECEATDVLPTAATVPALIQHNDIFLPLDIACGLTTIQPGERVQTPVQPLVIRILSNSSNKRSS